MCHAVYKVCPNIWHICRDGGVYLVFLYFGRGAGGRMGLRTSAEGASL